MVAYDRVLDTDTGARGSQTLEFRAYATALLFVCVVAIIAALPALILGYPNGHSTALNLHWAKSFAAQFWIGEWYPRWLPASFEGYGAPTFYYYAPVPFWWSSLFTPLFPAEALPLQGLALATAAATLVMGIGCFLWLHDLTRSHIAAALSASLYMIAPYQQAANFYMRTAFAEYVAAAILPFVLMAARRAAMGSDRAALALAASYAALVMTHLPTTVIASIIPAACPLFFATRAGMLRACLRVWLSMALGVAMACVYLLPALLEQHLIHNESWWQAIDYRIWFLFGTAEFKDRFLLDHVELLLCCLAALAAASIGCIALWSRGTPGGALADRGLWLNAAIVCLGAFLATALSAWFWEIVPPLQKIQFPWRALGITELGTAGLVAAFLGLAQQRGYLARIWPWLGHAGLAIVLLGFNWTIIDFHVLITPKERSEMRQRVALGGDAGEYTIAGVPLAATTLHVVDGVASHRDLPKISGRVQVADGKATVAVAHWQPPQRIVLAVRDATNARLQLAHFHHPIFRAEIVEPRGRRLELPMRPSAQGLLELAIPDGGGYRIVLSTVPLGSERIGWWIAGLAFGLWLILLLRAWWRDYRDAPEQRLLLASGIG